MDVESILAANIGSTFGLDLDGIESLNFEDFINVSDRQLEEIDRLSRLSEDSPHCPPNNQVHSINASNAPQLSQKYSNTNSSPPDYIYPSDIPNSMLPNGQNRLLQSGITQSEANFQHSNWSSQPASLSRNGSNVHGYTDCRNNFHINEAFRDTQQNGFPIQPTGFDVDGPVQSVCSSVGYQNGSYFPLAANLSPSQIANNNENFCYSERKQNNYLQKSHDMDDSLVLESLFQQFTDIDQSDLILTGPNQCFQSSTSPAAVQSSDIQKCSFPDTPPESGSEPCQSPAEARNSVQVVFTTGDANLAPDSNYRCTAASDSLVPPPYHSSHYSPSPGHYTPSTFQQSPNGTSSSRFNNGRLTSNASSKRTSPVAAVTQMLEMDPSMLQAQYENGSLRHKSKKRKHSISPPGTLTQSAIKSLSHSSTNSSLPVKSEPVTVSDGSEDDTFGYDMNMENGSSGPYQVIKWTIHQPGQWVKLVDGQLKDILVTTYRVDADKGFNFSTHDDSFVCQKKNHFQVTIHVGLSGTPKFISLPDGNFIPVEALYLHFYGVKMESQSQQIRIEQSQSDRSKKIFHPVKVELSSQPVTKFVVGRLHFSETTTNNMRKRGKPNPDQRYFQLVVALSAHGPGNQEYHVVAHSSERIIVRASNPGQFDGDSEAPWIKGKSQEIIYHMGNVGINTENPDESLTVHGNIKLTGHVLAPSDVRAKQDFKELDTSKQLKNISQIKVYNFDFKDSYAEYAGLEKDSKADTGVIAQEVGMLIPDAVREVGDVILPNGEIIESFLVVNKDRIFIEGLGAVKELCKVTDKLENRINEIELMNKKLSNIGGNRDSVKSTFSVHSDISEDPASPGNTMSKAKIGQGLPPLQTHHHHRHHHHHRTTSCHQQEEVRSNSEKGLCKSRVIQIIIIILVLIMAFCVTSVTTLYLLDRKTNATDTPYLNMILIAITLLYIFEAVNAGASGPNAYPQTTMPMLNITVSNNDTEDSTTDNGMNAGDPNLMSSNENPARINLPKCIFGGCYPGTCCVESTTAGIVPGASSVSNFVPSDGSTAGTRFGPLVQGGNTARTTPAARPLRPTAPADPTRYGGLAEPSGPAGPQGYGGPSGPPGVAGAVGPSGPRAPPPEPSWKRPPIGLGFVQGSPDYDYTEIGETQPPSTMPSPSTMPIPSTMPPSTKLATIQTTKNTRNIPTSTTQAGLSNKLQPHHPDPAFPDFKGNSLLQYIIATMENNQTAKKKRSLSDITLTLLSDGEALAVNLQDYYKTSCSCYDIPLEENFPLDNITIQFDVPSGSSVLFCQFGGTEQCSSTEIGVMPKISNSQWDLPVGYYISSNYLFHVYDDNKNVVCQQQPDAGVLQYKFTFSRPCS